ncbi:MAG: TrmH family RNA methyltransferase [Gammaproteobacteria bacterium]|nr:TrmH family RNA methyltransferase [Gammaproteobacteria bacterium]
MVSRQERKERHDLRKQALLRYKKQRQRNILAEPGEHDFIIVLDHLKTGFNIPTIFRSAEAMGAHSIHLVGIGPFDPAPAKGSFKKVPARFHDDFDSCYRELSNDGYQLFTLEPDGDESLLKMELPQKSAFILGHEEFGISFEADDYPDIRSISIPQFGSVESLNVSIAASIMMFEYVRQHHKSDS